MITVRELYGIPPCANIAQPNFLLLRVPIVPDAKGVRL